MTAATERCPWCGSLITHAKFLQIQGAMKARIEKELLKQIEAATQQIEKRHRKELADIRAILQKDRETALLKKEADFARERDALQKKVAEMSRRVGKTGAEIAEGAELDLFDELRGAFPEDQITVIAKGRAGGNLLHDIRYKGKSAGKVLIDPHPRGAWQYAFVTRLREDQSEVGADHAVLSTTVFPVGKRELFVESGVIVVAPARVRAIMEVLRKALIAMHVARLSEAERADKLSRLFKFITSPTFKRKLAEASALAEEALEIDVQEKRAHDTVWKKRGTVLTRIKNVLRDIDTDVSAIVEAREESQGPDEPPAALRPAAYRVRR